MEEDTNTEEDSDTEDEETVDSEESMEETSEENSEEASEDVDEQGRKLYKATCSDCGKECKVPFEPTEGKPVRCKDCFMKNRPRRTGGFNDRGRGGNSGGFNRRPREEHPATCSKCSKACTVPFKPSGEKPVLCRDCYKKSKGFD